MPRGTGPVAVPAADLLPRVAPYRYWGDHKPPKSRAEMFSVSVAVEPRAAFTEFLEAALAAGDEAPADAGGSVATIRIYGPIDSWGGWFGISAADVAEALDGLGADVTDVIVRVNSPGGEAWEGLAIVNLLRAWEAATAQRTVTTVVDGIAASAGSIIACSSGARAVMSPGTQLMIHDAWCFAMGNAAELATAQRMLDSISDSIAALYSEAAGGTDAGWRDLMRAETWYTAKEAVAVALMDEVAVVPDQGPASTAGDQGDPGDPDEDVEDSIRNRFDLKLYQHAGRSQAPAPQPPAASAPGSTPAPEEELVDFTDEQLATMRHNLGLPETADAATIVAAQTEALAEQAEDTPPPTTTPPVPEGMVLMDQTALDAMRAQAASGQAARDQQLADHRDLTIAAAVKAGKFAPARADHFRKLWAVDAEGTEAQIGTLAAGVVPVDERGHDQNGGAANTTTPAYDALYGATKEGE